MVSFDVINQPKVLLSPTLQIRIRQIVQETADTKTFILDPLQAPEFSYKAGQFITFIIQHHGHETRRSYSFSSAPATDPYPFITIKRVPNGEMSRYWHEVVREGDVLLAQSPSGRFTLDERFRNGDEVVLIGAGSGFTPLFSLLKDTLSQQTHSRVVLLLANRNHQSILFKEQLVQWQQNYSHRLQVIHILSQPSDDWNGIRGRLNNMRLETLILNTIKPSASAHYFLCGPFELMRTIAITLKFVGIHTDQIRKEHFIIPTPAPVRQELSDQTVSIRIKETNFQIRVPAHDTILDAALKQHIPIPYSCKGGRCSSCAAQCESGEVYMSVNEVLTDRDLKQGWILTCTSYPVSSDVSLLLP